jgi:chromosome segregation ATPase
LESILKSNSTELTSINSELPTNIEKIISFIKDTNKESGMNSLKNQLEEYKKLQIAKDSEISKLNDINSSKQNEIDRLKNIIEEQKKGNREKQLEEEIKLEKEKLNTKINDLELKIYNLNDEKNVLTKENNNLKEQIEAIKQKEENKDNINQEKEKEDKDIIENNKIDENKDDNNEIEKIKKEKEELSNNYEQLMKEKLIIEDEKNRLFNEYNNILEENNKIKNEKNDLNDEYNKLKSEYDKLKEEFNNNEIRLKTYIAQENINKNNTNDDLYITKLTELDELKLKISKYESGELIPNTVVQKYNKEKSELKNQLTSEFKEKEKNYIKNLEEKDKKILEYVSKIKQGESRIKILNENIIGINQEKGELENIVIKQESRVGKLGEKVDKIESLLKNKNDEIRENENYSLKLINIIKEQKNLIYTLKKEQKSLEENNSTNEETTNTINSLKAQITALKRKLDVKEDSFLTLQKSHKILQEKYLKTCSNNRKKEQELLLNQAKKLRADKIQREKDQLFEKNKKRLELKKELMEKNYSSLNNFKPKKLPTSASKNKNEQFTLDKEEIIGKLDEGKNDKSTIQMGPVLPIILSSKNKERIERMKLKSEDDGKFEEISDMMNNIINEL